MLVLWYLAWPVVALFPGPLTRSISSKRLIRQAHMYLFITVIVSIGFALVLEPVMGLIVFLIGYAILGHDLLKFLKIFSV